MLEEAQVMFCSTDRTGEVGTGYHACDNSKIAAFGVGRVLIVTHSCDSKNRLLHVLEINNRALVF